MNLDISTLSQKQINKVGKRFRDAIHDENDFAILEEFKKSYNDLLIEITSQISKDLNKLDTNYVMAGRLKRTTSIIRKLQRINNKGMDLTRMSDIAGTRIIVKNLEDQNKIINVIKENYNVEKEYNYIESNQNYKSIHIIIKQDQYKYFEIQIRTLAQQTWADESEEYGEQAKQGLMSDEIKKYLTLLSDLMYKIDKGINVDLDQVNNHLYDQKTPVTGKYKIIQNEFEMKFNSLEEPNYYLIVYDSFDSTLISKDIFSVNEKDKIFQLYKYKSEILDENRYEIIFFVSSLGSSVLKVSHPRFFMR